MTVNSRFRDILGVLTQLEVETLQLHPRFKALKLIYARLNRGLDDHGLPIEEKKAIKREIAKVLEEVGETLAERLLPPVWAHPLLQGEAPNIEEEDPLKEVGRFDLGRFWKVAGEITDMLPPGQDTVAILQLREFMFSQMARGGAVSKGGKLMLEIDPRLPSQVLRRQIENKILEHQKRVFGSPVSNRLKLYSVSPQELSSRVRRVLLAYKLKSEGASFPQIAEALLPGGREDTLNFLKAKRLVQRGEELVENGVFAMLGTGRFFYKLPSGED